MGPGRLGPLGDMGAQKGASPLKEVDGKDFKSFLLESLEKVNAMSSEADDAVQRLATGQTDNVAEVFTTVQKAGVAFDLLMEIRNKLLDAYTEIRQMRV